MAEAQRFISEIELEAKAAPLSYRGDMLANVRQFREINANFHTKLRKINEKLINVPNSVSFSADTKSSSKDDKLQKQILKGSRILEQTSQSIERYKNISV